MTQEAIADLHANLYGDCLRSLPWHTREGEVDVTDDGSSNYYPGAIPLARVRDFMAEGDIDTYPVAYGVPDGADGTQWIPADARQAIVGKITGRFPGRLFGVFGADSYVPHQPSATMTDTLAGIVGTNPAELHYSGAGFLRRGGRQYVAVSTSDLYRHESSGIEHFPWFTMAGSVDGSLATVIGAGSTLPVCDNTLAAALGESKLNGTQTRFKHTKFSASKLDAVALKLGLEAQADALDAALTALVSQTVTDAQWAAFVVAQFPTADDAGKAAVTRAENGRALLTQLWNADERVSPWRGTAFGALQAANTAEQWSRGLRGDAYASAAERTMDEFVSGKLAARENSNAELLASILAAA